jgi:tripartite ATP-independent transporter DctM subunit
MAFIVYSILTGESVGKLYIAGVLPGLLLATIFSTGILIWTKLRPELIVFPEERAARAAGGSPGGAPAAEGVAMAVRVGDVAVQGNALAISAGEIAIAKPDFLEGRSSLQVIARLIPVLAIIGLVLGGIYAGWFTAVEAGAVGCFGSLALAIAKRTLTWSGFRASLKDTGYTVGALLFLIICAQLYSRMLQLSGVSNSIEDLFLALNVGPYGTLAIILIIIFGLGCLIDTMSIFFIMTPIVLPLAKAFGFDLIWLGVVLTIAIEVGLITPPFGISVFGVKATIGNTVTVEDIFAGSRWFVLMMILCIIILIAFPQIATFLVYRQ